MKLDLAWPSCILFWLTILTCNDSHKKSALSFCWHLSFFQIWSSGFFYQVKLIPSWWTTMKKRCYMHVFGYPFPRFLFDFFVFWWPSFYVNANLLVLILLHRQWQKFFNTRRNKSSLLTFFGFSIQILNQFVLLKPSRSC